MKAGQRHIRTGGTVSSVRELFRARDELGEIVVSQQGDKRQLNFGSRLEQSSLLMQRPHYLIHEYTQIMLLGLLFVQPRHITLLGLGGGGLGHCLRHYFPDIPLQFVEIRQLVIDIAYELFELPRSSQLKVCCADAFDYMASAEAVSTDLILSDLYEAQGMSEVQMQQRFVENAHRVLSQNGWLVINFHELPQEGSLLMMRIRELFDELYVCDVFCGNWILFCGKSASGLQKAERLQRARQLTQQLEMPLSYYARQLQRLA